MSGYVALVLTALPVEMRAVLEHLGGERSSEMEGPVLCEAGDFTASAGRVWRVIAAELGPGTVDTAGAVVALAGRFRPDVVMFAGIAGALKDDVAIGDVVAGTEIAWTERGKWSPGAYQVRVKAVSLSAVLSQLARKVARDGSWTRRLARPRAGAKAVVGQIASGEKVVADAEYRAWLREAFSDAVAIENEGFGLARAAEVHADGHRYVVRGISDNADGSKSDDGHAAAADAAAAFAFELLDAYSTLRLSSEAPGLARRARASGDLAGPARVTGANQAGQVLGVAAVPVAAAVKDPAVVFAAVDVEAFTGREWLATEVDQFLGSHRCGYVLVEAEAGLGKTAFAAWLVKTRGYVAHFSRYAGGRTVSGALRNLSAQLIQRFGLDDLAPGGMLPEWAQASAGFEQVLGAAATRARAAGTQVVLVVDGLDEAEPGTDGLLFGLPGLLPDGAYVIGTYRSGRPPGRPDAPAVTVRIGATDPRNTADIRDFLARAVTGEPLAGRLAQGGIAPADFMTALVQRCNGVWVYLRYVLEEVRLGQRPPGQISDLPSGLHGYYAAQIRRWQDDPSWNATLLPLLATLAVAGEPLPTSVLARLAGDLDQTATRRCCDLTFRPLLTTTRAAGTAAQRHEIYHASFRDMLTGHPGEPVGGPGGQPSELDALADELRSAALAAHVRIAGSYLDRFGRLQAGLPVLAADPGTAGTDDGYPLRHLARHLHHAGQVSELHELLTTARADGSDREVNVWFAAHDHADCLASYLDDLARARAISAASTDHALGLGQLAPSLGAEVRYALMAASITSRAARISPQLLDQLIQAGLWSAERGLDHARRLTSPVHRYQVLLAVRQHASTDRHPSILSEALAAATVITDEGHRARALTVIAPHLSPAQLDQALAVAAAITDEDARAWALADLAPHLLPAQLDQALAAATVSTDENHRARALVGLAPHLLPAQLDQALAAATVITDEGARAEALAGLAPHLPPARQPDVLDQALAAAATSNENHRARVLAGLAPQLPAAQLDQALAAATAITDEDARARALAGVAPHLPPARQPDALDQALAAATAITDEDARAWVLVDLAPHLLPAQLDRALAAATVITDEGARAEALVGLVPHLPPTRQPDALDRALAAATVSTDEDARAQLLADLAPCLLPAQLDRALAAATVITDEGARARALAGLVPHLPPARRPDALDQALAVAAAITNENHRAWALADLAPHLPPAQLDRALAAATAITDEVHRAWALADLAPHLPPARQPDALDQALAAATAITDQDACAEALASLAPHLPPGELRRAMAMAPVNDVAAITALLERGKLVLASTEDHMFLDMVRAGLDGASRRACLKIVALNSATIAEIGGGKSIEECVTAIADVCLWWP